MKILFFHNTIADYRLPFFEALNEKCDLVICLTDKSLNERVYKTAVDEKRIMQLRIIEKEKLFKTNSEFEIFLVKNEIELIILPTLDSLDDARLSWKISNIALKCKIKMGYFWEKWEAKRNVVPFAKKIKNVVQFCVAKTILKRVDIFWYPGKCTKDYFKRMKISEDKLYKIHDSSVMPKYQQINLRKEYNIPNNKILILYFGRVIERKGLGVLLEAMTKISKEKFHLLVAGDGDKRKKYEEYVGNYNLNNITFIGSIEPKQRYAYFCASDIFVLPSIVYHGTVEAWGLTLNEAMQVGKYIISTDAVGSAYELIEKGNGIMVKQNSVNDLVSALEKSEASYNLPRVKEISEKLLEEYNYDRMSDDIILVV